MEGISPDTLVFHPIEPTLRFVMEYGDEISRVEDRVTPNIPSPSKYPNQKRLSEDSLPTQDKFPVNDS